MQKDLFVVFFLSLLFFLFGCSSPKSTEWPTSTKLTAHQAYTKGFNLVHYQTSTFTLSAFEKMSAEPSQSVHVYIEGDGNSWKSRYVLSKNPTPRQPLALQLALKDPHPHVIYLARPCQYTPFDIDKHCKAKYWSSHRYAPEVIESFNDALDQIKLKNNNAQFYLVGFSGGASVATLLASKRKDVSCLVTVAGDLNHQALNKHHRTSPLMGSLNPISVAPGLASLAQYHLSGESDKTVPPWVAQQFAEKVNNTACVKTTVLPGVKHHQGWLEHAEKINQFECRC